MSEKNLYEILGVRPDASQAEIRAAYLKLAKQWHPDRNTGNEAEAERRFKEIAHAYEVLSNSEKRAAYDAASEQSSGFESTMDEADAFDLFISVLLDLAFELAENGSDQITIYQALVDMGCPSGTAKTLAQKAHKLGGKSDAGKSSGESAKPKAESRRGNGGGGETTNATASVTNEPDETFPAGPWSRWFARSLDLLVGAAVASPLIGLLVQFMWTLPPFPSPDRIALYLMAIAPLPFIVDAIIVGVFGNSLGKALLKIKVHSKLTVDGVETLQPIYFDEAIQRNFKIWLWGYWISIPVLAIIPQFLAYLKVSEGKPAPWDLTSKAAMKGSEKDGLHCKYEVVRQKTRWELITAFVVCFMLAPAVGKAGAELFMALNSGPEASTIPPDVEPEAALTDKMTVQDGTNAIDGASQGAARATSPFPAVTSRLSPISLGDLIYQSVPDNDGLKWDSLQIPQVIWITEGIESSGVNSSRMGFVRVRAGAETAKVLRGEWEELAWSVVMATDGNPKWGPDVIEITPGFNTSNSNGRYICFGEGFMGCDFPVDALSHSKLKLERRCEIGASVVMQGITSDGRVGTIIHQGSGGSGGLSNSVVISTMSPEDYCATYKNRGY